MHHREIQIRTQDGMCPTQVYHPDGDGPWPSALVYMDGIGYRPAIWAVAEQLASNGYYVMLPNLFYRVDFEPTLGPAVFADPVARQDLMTRVIPSASAANVMRDTETFFEHFENEPKADASSIGVTGYCLGGRLSIYAAGHFGDRIKAAASYHGGGLATDAPDSPHRLAPNMTAKVYVAGAIEDKGFDDAQKARLAEALTSAGVDYKVETYNAHHGFVPRDTPAHDDAAEARHWETLLALFGEKLGRV